MKKAHDRIIELVQKNGQSDVRDDVSLFSPSIGFQACDMAFLLVELQKEYGFSMSDLVKIVKIYSVNELASTIEAITLA